MLFHSQLTGHRICRVILSLLWAMLFREQILLQKLVIKMFVVEILLSHIRLVQSVVEQEVFVISSEADQLLRGGVVSTMLLTVLDQ